MITKKKSLVLLVALLLVGIGYAAFSIAYDQYEQWNRTRPQRLEAERQARLNEQIRGYVSDAAVKSATFRMTTIVYFGGRLQEWEYDGHLVTYRERAGMPHTPTTSVSLQFDVSQWSLFTDIVNLVAKQELWKQPDVQQLAADGGEQEYKFVVDGHPGQFKVINASPPQLEVFHHKCWQLMESIAQASKSNNPIPAGKRKLP